MGKEKKDFFISYTSKDEKYAEWIAYTLEDNGYTTIIQKWDFKAGENFVKNMHKALTNSERFIAVLSPDYLKSLYCQAEWTSAFTKDPGGEKSLFIPVRITNIEPEGLFAPITYIDIFGVDEKTAEINLLSGVDIHSRPRNRPSFPGTKKVRFPGSLPFNNLPSSRNNYFTGREEQLISISACFESKNSLDRTLFLHGLGGIGKTQLALEYAYRFAQNYDWIWWVPVETENSIIEAYKNFSEELGLLNKNKPDVDDQMIIETVTNWMDTHSQWLFIFDNVTDLTFETPWFPKNHRANILVTTRNRHNHLGSSMEVKILSKEDACLFLKKRTQIIQESEKEIDQVAERLGFLPLALEQAAAYIKTNECSFKDYLNLLTKYGLEVLQETEAVINYKQPVTVTWKISMDKISSPAAQQLFVFCAYLAPETIYQELFTENNTYFPMPLKEDLSNELRNNELWKELTNYSLLSKQNEKYEMHRLLQEVLRMENKEEKWLACLLNVYYERFDFDLKNKKKFLLETAHVDAFSSYVSGKLLDNTTQEKIGEIYSRSGYGYLILGRFSSALEWYNKALSIRESVLGEDHPDTATTYHDLAGVYYLQGNDSLALKWYNKALVVRERVLGKDDPDTATTYNNLAGVYKVLGNDSSALEWYNKALVVREKVLGKDHTDTATTYNDLAEVYFLKCDFLSAFNLYNKALVVRERVLGKDDPDTATTYNNLASVYKAQGDYPMALNLYKKALKINERELDENHPNTATNYNNLAGVYKEQGDYSMALNLYNKALEIRIRVFRKNHPDTATTYNDLAGVYKEQGNYLKALDLYEKALNVNKRELGENHPNTAANYNNLAGVYKAQGDYPMALDLYNKALGIRRIKLGEEHLDTATTYNDLADVHKEQGDYPMALELYKKALEIRRIKLGEEHRYTVATYYNLELLSKAQGAPLQNKTINFKK